MATIANSLNRRYTHAIALVLSVCVANVLDAQSPPTKLEAVTVSARSSPVLEADAADVAGFDAPLSKTPASVSVIGRDLLDAVSPNRLASVLKLDASLSDNYNATGYFESLSVRGFALDQASNFRRNGLASSNYAPIALENKERIEVLKGVVGLQAGVAAPGGLVNFVTKQPLAQNQLLINSSVDRWGATKLHADINQMYAAGGVRLNLVGEALRNQFDGNRGERSLVSIAFKTAFSTQTMLHVEAEHHRQSQPSVPALGLLDSDGDGFADKLPSAGRLWRVNLNQQTWSQPVQSATTQATASLTHRWSDTWTARASLSHFASRINDRVAFADGCSSASNYVYPGLCANGDVDIYDFRSDNEKRRSNSFELSLTGRVNALSAAHTVQLSASTKSASRRLPLASAYNFVGTSNVYAPTSLAENAALATINTNNNERASDVALGIRSTWSPRLDTFFGVKSVRLNRESLKNDLSESAALRQSLVTPWFGASYGITPALTVYAQFSEGVEAEFVPNRPSQFTNAGATLSGAKSKQFELGLKWQIGSRLHATFAAFDIEKPFSDDAFNADGLSTRIAGGKLARHRGVEMSAAGRASEQLSIQASAAYLDARYRRALNPALVEQRVVNVPTLAASVFANYKVAAIPGFSINALLWMHSGKRADPYGSVVLPRATQLDLGASHEWRFANHVVTARLNIENVANRAYWREAPTTSWGGTYLFASTPRTVKLSLSAEL